MSMKTSKSSNKYSYRKQKTSIKFENYEKQIKAPFIVYVHFEAIRVPVSDRSDPNLVLVHKPYGFGYSIKCSFDDSLSKYEEYSGDDCAEVFWKKLEEDIGRIYGDLRSRKISPKSPNTQLKNKLEKEENCYFCQEELKTDRHLYFCNVTGQFIGVIHERCKLTKDTFPYFVPIVMAKLSKTAHFILKTADSESQQFSYVSDDSTNEYIAFTKKIKNIYLRFLDSSRFFTKHEIEDLEKFLEESQKCRIQKEFPKKKEFNLMKTKGSFPFQYVTSPQQLMDKKLPDEKGFYDRLQDADVTEEDFNWAKNVWSTFKCKNLGNYFQLYIKSNVFLLEDVFENFRMLCFEKYQLDPAQYFTVASLGWDAMLKFTKINLPMLQDVQMLNFFKSNIRGGINQCAKRHAKANNIYYSTGPINTRNPSTFIVYLDVNNSAGWAMSQYLPCGEFSWLTETEIEIIKKKIKTLKNNSEYGYVFEVDLDYPQKLHKKHNDLPFCCERLEVPPPPVAPKLTKEQPVLNLYNKRNYVIDYRNLQQCLANKLELVKIHRVLKFKQSRWLEPYIAYNTKLRMEAKNDFEVNLYKLLNNSLYGKTIQKSSYDKPTYAGFCILELQKHIMYNFHYNQILKKYKNKVNLLYTDTDSFIYEIKTDDFYRDLKDDADLLDWFDTFELDDRWKIPSRNKMVLGKMKDECKGKIIREFYSVGSKFYYLNVEGEEIKKATGVPKFIKKKHISKTDYQDCVLYDKKIEKTILTTSVYNHELQTRETKKSVLTPGDRKRCIYHHRDKISTCAWGFIQSETILKKHTT